MLALGNYKDGVCFLPALEPSKMGVVKAMTRKQVLDRVPFPLHLDFCSSVSGSVESSQMSVDPMGFADPLRFTPYATISRAQFTGTDSASFRLVLRNTLGVTHLEHMLFGCTIYVTS